MKKSYKTYLTCHAWNCGSSTSTFMKENKNIYTCFCLEEKPIFYGKNKKNKINIYIEVGLRFYIRLTFLLF